LLLQHGPKAVRKKLEREEALELLIEMNHDRREHDANGKKPGYQGIHSHDKLLIQSQWNTLVNNRLFDHRQVLI